MSLSSGDLTKIAIVAMLTVAGLTAWALYLGINGAVYGSVVAAFAAVLGAIATAVYGRSKA